MQDGSYERLRAAGCADEVAYVQACLRLFFAPGADAADGQADMPAPAISAAHVADNLRALDAPLDAATGREIGTAVEAAFRLPAATTAAAQEARSWGPRERFIVERLDGCTTPESIAAAWTDRGEQPMVAAQVKVFADQLLASGLAI